MKLLEKKESLIKNIKSHGKIAVAFSGGVDSTLLLKICVDALGSENVLAITANSLAFPEREMKEAEDFCKELGVEQICIHFNQLEIEGFRDNPPNRCYLCKRVIFGKIKEAASKNGFDAIAEGSNLDDDKDYRPGMQAIKELGVLSPLRKAMLTKEEIRELSRQLNLKTATKPSFACLATRFVYNQPITEKGLKMIDKGEQILLDMGFTQVRVRLHGEMARIEVEKSQIEKVFENREAIQNAFSEIGFSHTALDLGGYKTGSMNFGI